MLIIYIRLQNTHARSKWNFFECGNKVQRSQRLNLIQSLKEKPRQTVPVKRTDVHLVAASVCAGEREAASTKSATRASRSDEQADGIVVCFVVCRSSLHFCASLPSSTFNAQGDIDDGVTFSFFETTRWVFVCFVLKAHFVGTFVKFFFLIG